VNLTAHLQLVAGYSLLYWQNVVRPGDQLNPAINPSQRFGGTLVGPPAPLFSFNSEPFWVQSLNFRLEYRY